MYRCSFRRLCTTLAAFATLAGCRSGQPAPPPAVLPANPASSFFRVTFDSLSKSQQAAIVRALTRLEMVLTDERFLARIAGKSDWPFLDRGEAGPAIANVIRTRQSPDSGVRIYPELRFYTPPGFGGDVCGGFSIWGRPTSSTGCTSNGIIYRSTTRLADDLATTVEFLMHEWLHAADFGHGGNSGQCETDKRNSVPIHVACLTETYLSDADSYLCALSCEDAKARQR